MKKLLLPFAFFSIIIVSAQPNFIFKQPSVSAIPNKVSIDPMPNAIPMKPFEGINLGNNGQRFDLYKTEPDNMIVAKPDSSFYDNIPNAMNSLNGSSLSPVISQKLLEQLKNHALPENDNTKKPFKLIKPEGNKLLWNQLQQKINPTEPFLPR